MLSGSGSLTIAPVCTHANAGFDIATKTNGRANETTIEFICHDCGAKGWILTPRGPMQKGFIPWTWENPGTPPAKSEVKRAKEPPVVPQTPEQRIAAAESKIIADIGGDGPGTRLAVGFFRKGYHKSCQACTALAKQMNEWGGAGCRERLDEIVEDILPRAKQWVSDTHKFTKGVLGLVGAVVDVETPLLKTGIRASVVEALDEWDASQKGNDQ